jgi:hypothetical protein
VQYAAKKAGTMASKRPNTLVVILDNLPRKPAAEVLHFFVQDDLNIPYEQVKSFQISYAKKRLFIELCELNAEKFAEDHSEKHAIICDNEQYKITLEYFSDLKHVRLYDLPPNITNEEVFQKLSEFGFVKNVTNEVWGKELPYAGKNNGTRVAKMRLNKKIPSYLLINGETTYVTHQGQTATCRWCNDVVHFGQTCADNRSRNTVNERLNVTRPQNSSVNNQAQISSETTKSSEAELLQTAATTSSSIIEAEIIPDLPTTPETQTTVTTEKQTEQVSTHPSHHNFQQQQQQEQQNSSQNNPAVFQSFAIPPFQNAAENRFLDDFFKSVHNKLPNRSQPQTDAMDVETQKPSRNIESDDDAESIDKNLKKPKVPRTRSTERARRNKK